MTEVVLVPIEDMPLEHVVEMLREQVMSFQGYALSMAQKAGLTPEEAGYFWFESLGDQTGRLGPALAPRMSSASRVPWRSSPTPCSPTR